MSTTKSLLHGAVSLALLLSLMLSLADAAAQTPRQQAEKELARKMPGATVQACALVTRAEVGKAAGREVYAEPEPFGNGGWVCNIGIGEVKLYSGPTSWDQWESTLKGFKKENEPKTTIQGLGERAYILYPKPDNKDQGNIALLVAKSGNHTIALSFDAPRDKPAESMRPGMESLMKSMLSKLP
jgi:hypothetical protein